MRRKPGLMSVHQRLERTGPFVVLTSGEEALKIVDRSFVHAVIDELIDVIGAGKVSIKLSPVGRIWEISECEPVTF